MFDSVVVSPFQVAVGIICSLIVFPVNLILVQIFRNVRRKPKVRNKQVAEPTKVPSLSITKENLETYNRLKDSSDESNKGSSNSIDYSREKNNRTQLSINDVHTDVDRASFTDSPLLIDRRLSTTDDIGIQGMALNVVYCNNSKSDGEKVVSFLAVLNHTLHTHTQDLTGCGEHFFSMV